MQDALRNIGINTVVNGFLASQYNKNVVIIHNSFTTYLYFSKIALNEYEATDCYNELHDNRNKEINYYSE
jgi:hypothetical protein